MKNIFTLLISIFILGSLSAQNVAIEDMGMMKGVKLLSDEMKEHMLDLKKQSSPLNDQSNKVQALESFYIDYETYDIESFYVTQSFWQRSHSDFTANDYVYYYDEYGNTTDTVIWKFNRAAVAFKWLNYTHNGFDAYGYPNAPADSTTYEWATADVTIDTIFFSYLHEKRSLIPNDLRTRILPLTASGQPNYNATPLFTDIISTDSSLAVNGAVASIPVNLNLPVGTEGVAVAVDLVGGDKLIDEFYVLGTMPTNCTTYEDASESKFHPNSYFGMAVSSVFGSSAVNGFWPNGGGNSIFFDANGSGGPDDCELFFIQDWSIWMKVTADIPLDLSVSSNTNSVCEGATVSLSSALSGAVDPVSYMWTTDGDPFTIATPASSSTNISAEASAIYTLTATDADGTVVSTDFELIVDDITVLVGGDTEVECGTSDATLIAQATSSVDNSFTYQWSSSALDTFKIETYIGSHSVTVTNANGCSATEDISVSFLNSSLQSGFDYVNSYGSTVAFTNLSTSANSYVWDFGSNNFSADSDPVFAFASSGQYEVSLQAFGDGCIHETVKTIFVNAPTGIEDDLILDVRLFPNPASDFYNINVASPLSELIEVAIYNVAGELQYGISEMNSINDIVDLQEFAAGIYLVNITINDTQTTHKLIVNK